MKTEISINAKHLKALLKIAAKQDIRYYLNGVSVETTPEGGKFLVATDGHRIAVFHEGWGTDTPATVKIIVPREIIEQCNIPRVKAGAALSATLSSAENGKWILDTRAEAALLFTPIDGKFPEWRRVFPEAVSGEAADFNLEYITAFDEMAKKDCNERYGAVIWQNGKDAALVTIPNADFIGVLMPMRQGRSSGEQPPRPAWYPTKERESVAA